MHAVEEGLQEGDACAALYSEDNKWYRAQVQSVYDLVYTIQFVDLGHSETTSVSNLRRLVKQFGQSKAHAVLCQLPGIAAASDSSVEQGECLLPQWS